MKHAPLSRLLLGCTLSLAACGGGNPTPDGSAQGDATPQGDAAPSEGGSQGDAASTADGASGGDASADAVQIPLVGTGILRDPRMVTVVAQGDPNTDQIFAFANAVPGSVWWRESARDYNLGAIRQNLNVTGAALPAGTRLTQAQLEQYLRDTIAANPMAANDASTMYVLYLPPNVFEGAMGSPTCALHGYHARSNDGLVYGFTQHCAAGAPWLTELDVLLSTAAHEIIEEATNKDAATGYYLAPASPPWMGSAWTSPGQGEVGDLCDSGYWLEGGFMYQRSWSNSAARLGGDPCVPAIDVPYYNVNAPQGWYQVRAGASVMIPLTAFGASTSPWQLTVNLNPPMEAPGGSYGALAVTTTINGTDGAMGARVSSGDRPQLVVSAAAGAASGSYHILQLRSTQPTTERRSQDQYHTWFVGVYVP